jgi:zinc protease
MIFATRVTQLANRGSRLCGSRARSSAVAAVGLLVFMFVPSGSPIRAEEKAGQANPALQAASALYEGIRQETLANGLRVYLKPIPGAETVSTMVAYKVGSADEDLDATGLSHYLEHLMFKGTAKIMPGDIDRLTLRNGGSNNANTSEDMTVYYFDFASDRWEAALGVEADRMRNLLIDARHEFEQEKGAVVSELERDEDEPFDLEQKTIMPLLFGKTAPYGHPVIGERQHVRGATAGVIKAHYDKWYHPNNAALIVVGGFDADKALARITELFGPIPKAELPARKPVMPVERDKPIRREIDSKFEVPRLLMGFNGVKSGDPDSYSLDVVDALLSGGKTSRLYKKLVEGAEIASSINTGDSAGRYPGWFAIQVELLKGKDRGEAERLVLSELQRLRDEPVKAEELKRVKEMVLASNIFGRESVHGLAESIARGVTNNDLDYLKNYLPRILAVTTADVQRAARKYLDVDKRVVVWSVPRGSVGKPAGEAGAEKSPSKHRSPTSRAGDGQAAARSIKDARRVVLPNGLVMLLIEDHRLPIVVAQASVRHAALLEPAEKSGVAALTGRLLDEGTGIHRGSEIAELIENVGGALALSANGGSVKVLAPDRSLGLGLLFECLSQANFPAEAFAREKAKQQSQIDESEQQPDSRASRLFRELVYGKHPAGRPALGKRATVDRLTRDDCAAFYKQVFAPNNTIVALVGDFDTKQIVDEVTKLTANWKKADVRKPETPPVDKPVAFLENIVTMPEAAQLHFFMGHVGIRRDDPDYYKLLVMDYVLGTGPGFTDRLSARLRDREGLAYTVSANISSSAGEEPGVFTCYIGTDPKNFATVKKEFLEEIHRLRDTAPSKEEVEDAKSYLLGSLPFQLITSDRVAGQLLLVERLGLGLSFVDDFRKAVAAVTPEDVQAVAKKHLDPNRLVLVAAGAVDPKGHVLDKAPPPKR